ANAVPSRSRSRETPVPGRFQPLGASAATSSSAGGFYEGQKTHRSAAEEEAAALGLLADRVLHGLVEPVGRVVLLELGGDEPGALGLDGGDLLLDRGPLDGLLLDVGLALVPGQLPELVGEVFLGHARDVVRGAGETIDQVP